MENEEAPQGKSDYTAAGIIREREMTSQLRVGSLDHRAGKILGM